MTKRGSLVIFAVIGILVFSGCTKNHKAETLTLPVIEDKNFGAILLQISIDDFSAKGYKYGDSIDVKFSNGYELKNIPYYSGYYVLPKEFIVLGYPGHPWVAVVENFSSSWKTTGISESDTVTVSLNKSGKYSEVQEAFDLSYTNNRQDYATDEIFANFRAMDYSTLKKNLIYRSVSPCDNKINRAQVCDSLCKQTGIQYALNLSDSAEKYQAHKAKEDFNSPYYDSLVQNDCVSFVNIKSNYMSEEYAGNIAKGIATMLESGTKGPIVIHCVEGKDRTGYVCALIAALSGASYDEMVSDYLITYENFYGITDKQQKRKTMIKEVFFDAFLNDIAGFVQGESEKDVESRNYVDIAKAYFRFGGMTDEQIGLLENFIKN